MYYRAAVTTALRQNLREYGHPLMIFQTNESPVLEKVLPEVLWCFRTGLCGT